ncbi:PHP domain-containing protein [Bacillus xiapuensis]|uniref:DNA-directed DNA polymerase n=1 Tax=Bacillus xiapuensis TaxID=2014075 RepID=A0ABU6N858_9BACI|nr:PHP domain-containing protein [Bacillus xiapuensis]
MRYNNYHKHTHYSNIITPDCIVKPVDYAKRAIELGHTSICTTEHGYAGNIFEYYDVAKEYNLKFVFGIEYYFVDDRFAKDKSNSHLMILARNESGMKQMQKIMSEANKTGYYYKPRIDKELLFQLNPNDVVVTSTCVISYINKHDEYEDNFIKPLYDYFDGNFYLELHDNTHPMQVEYNKKILALHNKYKIPFIHATDSHYIYPEQDKDRTEFLNGKNIYYPEEEGFILDYPSSEDIFKRYEQQGVFTKEQVESALKNTLIIDEFEDIKLNKEIKMPSIYPDKTHEEKVEILKEVIKKEWDIDKKEIKKERYKDYIEGIQFETNIVEETKMEDYFLLNYEIIKRAKEKGGVLTRTGRGSAPSFYINKLLGFTEIDRLDTPVTLYPTRFMSKSRILETKSLPDIDFNTADPKPFIEASKEVLGEDNIYYMVAYGKMKDSAAFRNLCRAKGLKMDEYNEVAKDLDRYKNDPKWRDLIQESKKFLDVIDSISPHPCAFLLLDKPISEELGLLKVGDELCALIDSGTSDYWKFLKNDFLTVTVWGIIADAYKMINTPIHNIRELDKLIANDNKVWELYEKGVTATLNQTGTDSATPQVMRYKPQSVRELSAFVAGIRPSFESMKHLLLDRQPFSYGIPEFDAILQESDNFVLYQENIMATLVYAGFPEDETYGLLKAIAKKKEGIIEPIYERFINGFVEKTGSLENAQKVWKIIEDAVRYGFNSSHSLSVAYDSLYGAYLKANFPLEYYAVILNKYEGDTEMTDKIYRELSYFDVKVIPAEFGKAKGNYSVDKTNNQIVKGLASIKFLNAKVADDLLEIAKKQFNSFLDLLIDIEENSSINSRQMEILIKLDFFKTFGKSLKLYNSYLKFKERYKKTHKDKTKEQRLIEIKEYIDGLPNEDISVQDKILFEKEVLGYGQTAFPQVPKAFAMVVDIDTKFAPRLTLYRMDRGIEISLKVNKNHFYDMYGDQLLHKGDIIKVLKVIKKPKKMKVDNKWVDSDIMEDVLAAWEMSRRYVIE